MKFDPAKIIENYQKKTLDKNSAKEKLLSIIENSESVLLRLKSINVLGELEIDNDDEIFSILENLLISDANEKVRIASANLIKENFIERALKPMKWALLHEGTPQVLNEILSTLINYINNIENFLKNDAKKTLINEIKNSESREFRIGFQMFNECKETQAFTVKELSEILINYLTIEYLKKIYWRLNFKINNCKVVELDFLFKGLTKLPEVLKYLTSLKNLALRYNQITCLPDWIGSLINLEILNLNVNNIKKLPDTIDRLTSLKELLLWKNDLITLPASIGSISSLESLNLRLNQLERLPDSIGDLKNLRILNLHDNKLITLPESISKLTSLEILNLSWNSIKHLPDTITDLTSLKVLDLERNELISIPSAIGTLSSLEMLNLSDNKLNSIPESIGSLLNLHILNLSRNELKCLPNSIKKLNNLREIYLGDNPIEEIPDYLKTLKRKGLKIYLN